MLSRIRQFLRPERKRPEPPAAKLMTMKVLAEPTERADTVDVSLASSWGLPGKEGPVIAMIGTGIDGDHPDLQGRVSGGVSFVEGSPFEPSHPQDTHLAGIITGMSGPSDDWRVGAAGLLHPKGHYKTENFVDLRLATQEVPDEMAADFCDRMAADWHLQGRDSLGLTRRVATRVSEGDSPTQAYRLAKAGAEVEMHFAEELIEVGGFELERN